MLVRCDVRTGFGKGEPALAKLSSYKSMAIALCASLFISTILYLTSEDLTEWLTYDATIQGMLQDLIPLVALGNVVSSCLLHGRVDFDLVPLIIAQIDHERWNGVLGIDRRAGSLPPRNDDLLGVHPAHHAAHCTLLDTSNEI